MKQVVLVLGVFILFIIFTLQVQASAKLLYPKILPTSPWYTIKLLGENINERLIFNKQKKLEYQLARAGERISEINVLTGQFFAKATSAVKGVKTSNTEKLLAQTNPQIPASSPIVNFEHTTTLSPEEQLRETYFHLARMEGVASVVEKLHAEASTKRDVVKTLCLNDKLTQIQVAIRSAKDRMNALAQGVKKNNTEESNHHFVIISVLLRRVMDLNTEANLCIGEDTAFIGKTEVVSKIDPDLPTSETGDRPFSPPPDDILPPPPSVSVSASLKFPSFLGEDAKTHTALMRSAREYQKITGDIELSLNAAKSWESAISVVTTLIDHEKAIENLLPLVSPGGADQFLEVQKSIQQAENQGLAHIKSLDSNKGRQLAREVVSLRASSILRSLQATSGLTETKNVANKKGYGLNGVPINEITSDAVENNVWFRDTEYQVTLAQNRLFYRSLDYEKELSTYEKELLTMPSEKRSLAWAQFGSDTFTHWVAFLQEKPTTNRVGVPITIYKPIGLSRQYQDFAVEIIEDNNPEAAAGFLMGLMDREIKILTDQAGQPYHITLSDGLTDYQQRLTAVVTIIKEAETGTMTPQILLVNEDLLKRGIVHAAYLTHLESKSSDDQKKYISLVVGELSNMVKDGVARIKKHDREEYASHQGVYKGLSQGLSQGLLQGLSQGLSQGFQQGLSQGLQQGLSQGMSQGLTQGMIQGLSQGFMQGLQFATGSATPQPMYENLWDYFVDPPSATDSALGYYQYISFGSGGDLSGGEDFSGGDDSSDGDDFEGGESFLGGNDFSGGDFSGGEDFDGGIRAIIVPQPTVLIQKEAAPLLDPLDSLRDSPTPKQSFTSTPTKAAVSTVPPTSDSIAPTTLVTSTTAPTVAQQPLPTVLPSQETTQQPQPTTQTTLSEPTPTVQGVSTKLPWWVTLLKLIF